MIRLAANLSTLFTELPFLDRFAAAACAGFSAVECQFPYEAAPAAVAARLREADLEWVLFNAPPGASGERGIACLPGREREFDAGIAQAAAYAVAGGVRRVHVMAGLLPAGADRAAHLRRFVSSIARAADRLAEAGAAVMIEPINTRVDVPGYLLDGTQLALECIAAAGRSNIRLQYDVYHMQIMEGDLMRSLERLLPSIGHVQIADNPGRHEPGTGEIAFERVLPHLERLGYEGFVGCEYLPAADTVAGLGWARSWLARSDSRLEEMDRTLGRP
ncbi:MAG: TIM barrel protein [Steroidobacteraceae bacterium]